MNHQTHLLKITDSCSQTCKHCPFARMQNQHTSLSTLLAELKASKNSPLLVSGGEPFEHPELLKVISLIQLKSPLSQVRWATGGHISLEQFLDPLLKNPLFDGISLGTDLLFLTSKPKDGLTGAAKEMWYQNLDLLQKRGLNYSLTFYLNSKNRTRFFKVIQSISQRVTKGTYPEYIYLRLDRKLRKADLSEMVLGLFDAFPGLRTRQIIADCV